ncbi:hypothetical protein KY342_02575 [Candidatus Woesearchaeota archaeon]|nr:hypothetical protein [Candidatus Woesearchaeota archaeon]
MVVAKIVSLAERLKGKELGERSIKMMAKEAKSFVEQAHEMEADGDYEKAIAYCEAACEDLAAVYRFPEEFEDKGLASAILNSTRFTQHFFAAKLYEKKKRYGDVLREVKSAKEVYKRIKEKHELFHPSFQRYLDELENLESKVKVHEVY